MMMKNNIFAASLLKSYCSSSSLILSSVVFISFYILPKTLCLILKGLSEARVVSFTKKEYGFVVHFFERFIKSLQLIYAE